MKGTLLFLLTLMGLISCNSPVKEETNNPYPLCHQNPANESFQFMRNVIDLSLDSSQKRSSVYLESGEDPEMYEEWLDVFPIGKGRYLETSIYNIYEQGDNREYYVQLMELDTNSLKKRASRDLQFRVTPDTAYPTLADTTFFRYTGYSRQESFSDTKIDLFLLEGYEHSFDITYGHLKWWAPQLGAVLIWYGEDRYFQLAEWSPSPLNQTELKSSQ